MLPFDGGPEEQAVRTQTVQVLPPAARAARRVPADLWRVLAPVTERGEFIGLLELYLPERARRATSWRRSPRWRTCWRSW